MKPATTFYVSVRHLVAATFLARLIECSLGPLLQWRAPGLAAASLRDLESPHHQMDDGATAAQAVDARPVHDAAGKVSGAHLLTAGRNHVVLSAPEPNGGPITLREAVNTPAYERFPSISRDGKYFFFIRSYSEGFVGDQAHFYWADASILDDLRIKAKDSKAK